jgi:ubiquinone/menaquinone biosynthesis C-methylase UbiE
VARSRVGKRPDYVPFDRVADTFDRIRFVSVHVLRRAYRLVFKKLDLKGEITILDAGVGTGRTIRPLMLRKVTLIGGDISLPMLSRLKQRYGRRKRPMELHLVMADVRQLPIRSLAITWVQSSRVLHLVRNWKSAVREWICVLVPNGSLVIFQETGDWASIRQAYNRALARTSKAPKSRWYVYAAMRLFLRRRGWCVRQEKIKWIREVSLAASYQNLKKRSYSRQWNLPEKTHAEAMAYARKLLKTKLLRGVKSEHLHRELLLSIATKKTTQPA